MKKILSILALTLVCIISMAQNGPEEGFYRVVNNGSNYYMRVEDNTGSINIQAMTADMGAIQLWEGREQNLDKPSSIIFFKNMWNGYTYYDFQAQGTGVHEIIGDHWVLLSGTYPIYQVSASEGGMTLYLSDSGDNGFPFHNVGTGSNVAPSLRRWKLEKVDANSDNYLGINPSFTANGKHYAPFYASFAISFASSGMKGFYVSKIDGDIAVISEITSSVIPASTPCLIECSSTDKSQNRVNVLLPDNNTISSNLLAGRYFCNEFRSGSADAKTVFDENTMRVFNIENGKLVLNTDKSTLHQDWLSANYPAYYPDNGERYINANTSFLPVSQGTPSTLTIMTEAEYEEYTKDKPVESITLSSTSLTLELGQTHQLSATVMPADATNPALSWTSSDSNVATVSSDGVVTAVSFGTATITASSTDGSGISASCTVNVEQVPAESIIITPNNAELYIGETLQLTYTIQPSNATYKNVTWSSTDENVATVNADGIVVAKSQGTCTINATSVDGSGVTGTCTVNVYSIDVTDITVTPGEADMHVGESMQLSYVIMPSNASNQDVTWTSSNDNIATVSADGLVEAKDLGTCTIKATSKDGSGAYGTCTITVSPVLVTGITVTPDNADMYEGETIQLSYTIEPENASNKNVAWSTTDATVATVSTTGLVTAVGAGTCTIKATSKDGTRIQGTCDVTCTADGIMQITSHDGTVLYYSTDGKSRHQLESGINIVRTASGKVIKVIKK